MHIEKTWSCGNKVQVRTTIRRNGAIILACAIIWSVVSSVSGTCTKVGKYHRGGSSYEGVRGVKVEGLTSVCFFEVLVW